ncbi:MAG: DUF58 domain-containing protein [Anaerolineae bacterium]
MRRFAPFLLILFAIAALLRVDFFFTIVYLFFGVYLLSRLWARRMAGRLEVARRFASRAFQGDRVAVDVTIHNASWLPVPWLELHEALPVQLIAPPFHREVVSLGPQERRKVRYMLNCRRRGYYPIGPMTMQTGDLLGIERQSMARAEASYITVYPRVVPLHKLGLPTRSPLAALPAAAHLFQDPARIIGVRDYQRGDSPRRIHWTATASSGRLLVKQYQPAIARETLLCLDMDQNDYERGQRYTATELAIVVAASLASHIVTREGLPAGLATEAHDPMIGDQVYFFLPPRPERAHLMSLLEVLARVQVTSEMPFDRLLRRASVNLAWGATLAVITGRESESLFDTLVYLRRAGFAVTLILVQPGRASAELRQQSDLLHLPVHHVWREQDMEMWS